MLQTKCSESRLRVLTVTRLGPVFLSAPSLFQAFIEPLNYICAKLKYFISSDLTLWFPFLIIFIFLKYDILIQGHLLLFRFFLRELFWFGQLAFSWPQGEMIELSWFDWMPKPNPSVVQVCFFSRCSFVQLHVHHLFAAIILFCKESFQNCLISKMGEKHNARKDLEL